MKSQTRKTKPLRDSVLTHRASRLRVTNPRPFSRVLISPGLLITCALLLWFTNWLGHRWLFERATLLGNDVLLSVTKVGVATHFRVITVDAKEYADYLGEGMLPDKLSDVIAAILKYEPKVLAIDVDTSQPRFQQLHLPRTHSRMVWARVARQEQITSDSHNKKRFQWVVGEVLGNRPDQPSYAGNPLFPQDADWTVRGYQRAISLADARVPSLHWEIVRAYCDAVQDQACAKLRSRGLTATDDVQDFVADWDVPQTPLSDLMAEGGSAVPRPGALGDIVLLGASFGDIHPTPFGPKLGAELIGAAVESELAGVQFAHGDVDWSKWPIKIFLAIFIAWLNTRLAPVWAASSTLCLVLVIFVGSFLGTYYGIFRLEFVPFMLGVWIEQLIEGTINAHHIAAAKVAAH